MRIKKVSLLVLSILFFLISSCNKDSSKDIEELNLDFIRPAIRLSNSNIPILKDFKVIRGGESPWLWEAGWENHEMFYVAKFDYSWELKDMDFINVVLTVTESDEYASKYLRERLNSSTIPLSLTEREDSPAIVGDISYDKGSNFIRDNIVIEIHNESSIKNMKDIIAKQIDSILIASSTFHSIKMVKPIIKEFEISKDTVVERTKTALIIQTEDPNNKGIIYKWRLDSGAGGIVKDDFGNFYYSSGWAGTSNTPIKLTLIAINDYGFCADSTIYIHTIKK